MFTVIALIVPPQRAYPVAQTLNTLRAGKDPAARQAPPARSPLCPPLASMAAAAPPMQHVSICNCCPLGACIEAAACAVDAIRLLAASPSFPPLQPLTSILLAALADGDSVAWGVTATSPDFLRMMLRKERLSYLSGDYASMEAIGRFIGNASTSCAADVRAACDQVAEQVRALLTRRLLHRAKAVLRLL